MKKKEPDRRPIEKMILDLSKLLKGQNFKSKKQLQEYLDGVVREGVVPETFPKSAIDFAQEIVYEVWETESRKERIKLAKEALSISSDCADAYNLLAEEADTLEEAKELYQQGVNAGKRALGKEFFKKIKGIFGELLLKRNERRRIPFYTRVSTEDQAKEGYSLELLLFSFY